MQRRLLQAKLPGNQPDDSFEPEAALVAELTGHSGGPMLLSAATPRHSAGGGLQRLGGNQSVRQMRHGSGGRLVPAVPLRPSQSGIVQRKCACGGSAGMSGECEECSKKQQLGLQTKLQVNEPGDIYEQEADRIADQVTAMPVHHAVSGAPLRIQRFVGQSTGQAQAVPASVDQAVASPGRPLEPAIRQDMEQRFGYDFSRVRVHAGAAAEQSARDVNAHAYTVGHDIVFDTGRFAPGTHEGRQLLAHELAHVIQQTANPPVLQRYVSCRQLLDAPTGTPVSEKSVQDSLAKDARQVGKVEQELDVPAGSATPWRTEPGPGRSDQIIEPQVLNEFFGISGRADIAVLSGTTLEILEVKEATWPSAVFAETQLLNYVSKGRRAIGEMEQIWRARGHSRDKVTSVRGMPQNRLDLNLATRRIGGKPVSLAWCRNGVIVFKARGKEDKEVLYCGIRDRGRTNAFLNSLLGPAQDAAERFVQQQFVTPTVNAATRNPLYDLLQQPKLKAFVQAHEAEIKAALQALAHQSVEAVRQRIQTHISILLEESAMILCGMAAELTAAEVLAQFLAQLERFLFDPNYIFVPLSMAPAFIAQPEQVPIEESGPSFRERVSEITGLTGTALTIYLIISEGSRIFPLRNLIPVP